MKVEKNINMANFSYWEVGGVARYIVTVDDLGCLESLRKFSREVQLPIIFIGNTTNLLFSDGCIEAILVKLGASFKSFSINDDILIVGAAAFMPAVVRNCANSGMSGLEHLIGVPASVGGIICMNGGSQRKSISENIISVTSTNLAGVMIERASNDCNFTYRDSLFQSNGELLLSAKIKLKSKNIASIRRECLSILQSRNKKFPRKEPSCGSVFVSNPEAYKKFGPPGKMIEDCLLKGKTIGGAQISNKHANFIVNKGGATSSDVLQLINLAKEQVYKKFNVNMLSEVKYVSERGTILPCHEVALS
jgi:UDP-N-acetylmuramate dehydrogenase